MMRRFEDSEAWKKARVWTRQIYLVSDTGTFGKDFGLKDQIRRAAVSVMSNLAEGYERESDRDTMRFVSIAKGSAAEVRCQLYIALDVGHLDRNTFVGLLEQGEEIARIIGGIRKSIQKRLDAR
ncbi:MAG: four helix bundle protein [Planctomycetota bacterium]